MEGIEQQSELAKIKPRQTHKKSRNGCVSCKARKIKCDETRPECNNCRTRAAACSYPQLQQMRVATPQSGGSSRRSIDPPPVITPTIHTPMSLGVSIGSDLDMAQMELLHNYCTYTAQTISRNPTNQTIWRVNVVQAALASSSSFAMRALLTLSAYHFAQSRPSQRDYYVSQAVSLYDPALQQVIQMLPSIHDDDVAAVWVFSAVTCLISCARPRKPGAALLFFEETGISQWLRLFRGARSIMLQGEASLCTGPLGPIFSAGWRRNQHRHVVNTETQESLVQLKKMVAERVVPGPELEAYEYAIDELAKSFAVIWEAGTHGADSSDVFTWFFEVTETYLDLLGRRKPEALAIFAYFCVVLKHVEWAWWANGWSEHLIGSIYHALDPERKIWIQWPIEQLGWIPS